MEERVVLSTLTVVSDADAGPGSLREALAAAQPGDVVQFDPGLDGRTIYLTSGELYVDEDLTIQGPGASLLSIDAGGLSRVFDLESAEAEVTISGLTIRGGKAEMGGGVLVQGGGLTLVDSVIVGNLATAEEPGGTAAGGGVAVLEGGSLTANDTVFAGNIAQGGRGADGGTGWRNGFGGGGYGGGVYTEGSSLTIVGGSFLGNRAVGGRGGDGGAGEGTSSTVARNDFGGDAAGGGLYVESGSLSIFGATLADNEAQGGAGGDAASSVNAINGRGGNAAGGALYLAFSWPPPTTPNTLSGNTFRNNGARGGSFAVGDYQGSVSGGAVATDADSLIITDCDFLANWIEANYGSGDSLRGANISRGGAVWSDGGLSVTNSRFVGNRASGATTQGGAICSSYLAVADSTFRGNQVTGWFNNGGAISANDSDLSRSTFEYNAAIAHGDGGGVSGGVVNSSSFRITDCDFAYNTAIGGDGGTVGSATPSGDGGEIIGGVVSTLLIFPFGGGSAVRPGQFNYFIDRSSFTNNLARGGRGHDGDHGGDGGDVRGGDVAVDGWLSITDSKFTGTRAIGGDGGNGSSGGAGGSGGTAIGGSVSVVDDFGNFDEFNTGPILIDGSTFHAVAAQGGRGGDRGGRGGDALGGAVAAGAFLDWVYGPLQVPLTISNSQILGAVARGGDGGYNGDGGDARGGAIFLGTISDDGEDPDSTVDIAATLTNLSIRNNTALGGRGKGSGRGGDAAGGGLFVDRYSRVFLNRGVIAGNRAIGGLGGGAGNAGAGVGGGVYLTTGGSTRSWTLIMRNYASTLDDDIHGMFS